MLHELSSIVELLQSIWCQAERLRHKSDKPEAQALDLAQVPQIRLLEPWHVLLFRPLIKDGTGTRAEANEGRNWAVASL